MLGLDKWFADVIEEIMFRGIDKETRSGVTRSIFAPAPYVSEPLWMGSFPLWTTKKCMFGKTLREGLFFLTGSTRVEDMPKDIRETWWKPWAENSRDFGKFYGYQLRKKNGRFDQVRWLENELEKNPDSRRLVISAFNNEEIEEAALPSCHITTWQFYVRGNELDMFAHQRSGDLMLGIPHNVAWAAQFLILLANSTSFMPGRLTYVVGDCHIYEEHFEQAKVILDSYEERISPRWSLKPEYLGLSIDEVVVRAEQNCLDARKGFDVPIKLEGYKPKLTKMRFHLNV